MLSNLASRGVELRSAHGVDLNVPLGLQYVRGNALMNRLGMAFRRFCRERKIETPPATWNLHLYGRGENDAQSSYPVLDSSVKAAHTKPILFFLAEISRELSEHCNCI